MSQGDDGYEVARKIWNDMIDKRPALIARCADAEDVSTAVAFARDTGALIAVRGGGHNIAGNAVTEGGLMIDLSKMKHVRVEPATGAFRSSPAPRWPISMRRRRRTGWRCRAASTRRPASPG